MIFVSSEIDFREDNVIHSPDKPITKLCVDILHTM